MGCKKSITSCTLVETGDGENGNFKFWRKRYLPIIMAIRA